MRELDQTIALPKAIEAKLREARVVDPDRALRTAKIRRRAGFGGIAGRLNLVLVADAGDDRADVLARVRHMLDSDWVDGVAAPLDLIEDLLLIHDFERDSRPSGLLDNRLLLAVTEGQGETWRGASPGVCRELRLDGLYFRTLGEVHGMGRRVADSAALPGGSILEVRHPSEAAGIVSHLEESTRGLWLASTGGNLVSLHRSFFLPLMIQSDPADSEPARFLRQIEEARAAGIHIRGTILGNAVLYPGDLDPRFLAEVVGRMLHENVSAKDALRTATERLPLTTA